MEEGDEWELMIFKVIILDWDVHSLLYPVVGGDMLKVGVKSGNRLAEGLYANILIVIKFI